MIKAPADKLLLQTHTVLINHMRQQVYGGLQVLDKARDQPYVIHTQIKADKARRTLAGIG